MSLMALSARSSDWRLVRSLSGFRSLILFLLSLINARFLHFSRPVRSLMSLPGASRMYTFCSFSSVSSTLGSCLSTSRMAASRFLSGKGEAARAALAQAVMSGKTKTAAHAARAELWSNRFMVLIDPLAETRQENEHRLATGHEQTPGHSEPPDLFEHTPTSRRRKEARRPIRTCGSALPTRSTSATVIRQLKRWPPVRSESGP